MGRGQPNPSLWIWLRFDYEHKLLIFAKAKRLYHARQSQCMITEVTFRKIPYHKVSRVHHQLRWSVWCVWHVIIEYDPREINIQHRDVAKVIHILLVIIQKELAKCRYPQTLPASHVHRCRNSCRRRWNHDNRDKACMNCCAGIKDIITSIQFLF